MHFVNENYVQDGKYAKGWANTLPPLVSAEQALSAPYSNWETRRIRVDGRLLPLAPFYSVRKDVPPLLECACALLAEVQRMDARWPRVKLLLTAPHDSNPMLRMATFVLYQANERVVDFGYALHTDLTEHRFTRIYTDADKIAGIVTETHGYGPEIVVWSAHGPGPSRDELLAKGWRGTEDTEVLKTFDFVSKRLQRAGRDLGHVNNGMPDKIGMGAPHPMSFLVPPIDVPAYIRSFLDTPEPVPTVKPRADGP